MRYSYSIRTMKLLWQFSKDLDLDETMPSVSVQGGISTHTLTKLALKALPRVKMPMLTTLLLTHSIKPSPGLPSV
jgi:hypothetical protein